MILQDISLDSIESWAEIFQDIDIFRPIIRKIFEQENIIIENIENLTPGSNAVFRVDDYVIKIYVPKEVEELYGDFDIELEAMRIANKNEVNIPNIITYGHYEDVYSLPYIVMEYVTGIEASQAISKLDDVEKNAFIEQLNGVLVKLNIMLDETVSIQHIDKMAINARWDIFSAHIQEQIKDEKTKLSSINHVLVHGDLTGENVLVHNGRIQVIDFGDVRLAPRYYEYAPIVFDLLDCDPMLLRLFSRGKENFLEDVFNAVLIHDFGAYILRDFCQRHLKIDYKSLSNIQVVKDYLQEIFE